MWLNPQTWSVISGLATREQADKAMASVDRELNTAYGAKIMAPSYVDHYFDGALAGLFPPSTKENGGIFSQTQGWLILAEALLGNGNEASSILRKAHHHHRMIRQKSANLSHMCTDSTQKVTKAHSTAVHMFTGLQEQHQHVW